MYPSLTRFPVDLFDFDALFGGRGWPSSIRAASRGAFPALNVGTTGDAVEIYAFAPGLDPAKIEVTVDKGLLTIAGERPNEIPEESEKVSVYANERFSGAFRRVISLPEDVDATRVDAKYTNGVLRIAIPKRESSKPRRIEVAAAA